MPRLGLLRLKERGYLPTTGVHILSATVSEKGGRWFVSLQVEMELPDPSRKPNRWLAWTWASTGWRKSVMDRTLRTRAL